MTRMTTDIDSLSQFLQTGLVTALVNLLTFFGVGVALVFMNWELALITGSILPPLVIATLWFRRSLEARLRAAREHIAAVNANLQEGLSGVRVSQAYVREERNKRCSPKSRPATSTPASRAQKLVAIYFPFVEMLSEIAAAHRARRRQRARGERHRCTSASSIAFLLYLDLFFSPIQQLSQMFDSYQQARVASRPHRRAARHADDRAASRRDPVFPARLRGEVALRRRALPVPAARSTRRSAASTSTIRPGRDRRARRRDRRGQVDGGQARRPVLRRDSGRGPRRRRRRSTTTTRSRSTSTSASCRRRRSCSPARSATTSRSGAADATDAEVEAAARAVGAHDFIAALPGGYLQWVSERGRSLSSGQRQLIALARAHLVDPAILLLDEATSNLDLPTEAKVTAAMGVAAQGPHHDPHRAPAADRAPRGPDRRDRRRPGRRGRLARRAGREPRALLGDVGIRRRAAGGRRELTRPRNRHWSCGYVAAHVRDARRRTRPHVVAGRRPLPDLPALVRGLRTATASATCAGSSTRLDHLEWLGVDGIWLNPIFVSPNADWGYDVSDYCGVHPELGTLDDLDELVGAAPASAASACCSTSSRTTRATSTRGSATRSSRTSRTATGTCGPTPEPRRRRRRTTGSEQLRRPGVDARRGHRPVLPAQLPARSQPDLDWWNEDVREAFDDILRFWFDRGVAGFRIDVAHGIVKDRELRDNPPATEDDHRAPPLAGQRQRVQR